MTGETVRDRILGLLDNRSSQEFTSQMVADVIRVPTPTVRTVISKLVKEGRIDTVRVGRSIKYKAKRKE